MLGRKPGRGEAGWGETEAVASSPTVEAVQETGRTRSGALSAPPVEAPAGAARPSERPSAGPSSFASPVSSAGAAAARRLFTPAAIALGTSRTPPDAAGRARRAAMTSAPTPLTMREA